MSRRQPAFLLLAALLLAWVAAAQAAPQRIVATYVLSRNGQELGQTVETFVQTKGRYRIESVTRAAGVLRLLTGETVRLVSEGRVLSTGLRPLHFEHHRGSRPDRRIVADFDWKQREARLAHDGTTETVALPPGTQDRLSLMYQFLYLPLRQPVLTMDMTNGRKITRYEYRRVGEEALTTPAGTFPTAHYSRVRAAGDDGTEVWVALGRVQIPVKVVIEEEGGGRMEQVLVDLSVQ